MKRIKYILPFLVLGMVVGVSSCDDMLDMGNDDVLYADENHLTEGTDTVNSYVGILAQLQKIAVRTNLFGELRGDLVVVNTNAKADLKAIANFEVSDDNAYNNPRDYYAVINNCNYYLANADTALKERRFDVPTQSSYDFRVFQAEYCAVRSIRAWIYLQLGQIYGSNIPVVLDPILSLDDANTALSDARRMDLGQICSFFIDDLTPYVSWFSYPYHHDVYGYSMPQRMAVMPVQLVLGDLYLWAASIQKDPSLARLAARSYYDYIVWLPTELGVDNNGGYKQVTTTSSSRCYWDRRDFTSGSLSRAELSNYAWSTTSFGGKNSEVITAIAMDSLASESNYNELRVLYNYDSEQEDVEASISPSQLCYDYSDSQIYVERYSDGNDYVTRAVTADMLQETMLNQHYLGDLRLPANLFKYQRGDHDYESQIIWKTSYPQDVIIYRRGDVYLRMAEALNYAGFPKFALAILTTGLDNTVIQHDVLSQCTTTADSAFVSSLAFPSRYFKTRVEGYSQNGTPSVNLTEDDESVNQIGLHARGSGYAVANPYYYPAETDAPADSTGYPVQPPTYAYTDLTNVGVVSATYDALRAANAEFFDYMVENYGLELPDFSTPFKGNVDSLRNFNNAMRAVSMALQAVWSDAVQVWYRDMALPQVHARQVAVVDSLLDVESALETPFEGFRFGALMRAAYRADNPGQYMAGKVGLRDPSLSSLVSDPRRWFISWQGLIGE